MFLVSLSIDQRKCTLHVAIRVFSEKYSFFPHNLSLICVCRISYPDLTDIALLLSVAIPGDFQTL